MEAVEILVNAGATVDLPGHDGSGVLHVAAGATWRELNPKVMAKRVDISISNHEVSGCTVAKPQMRSASLKVEGFYVWQLQF